MSDNYLPYKVFTYDEGDVSVVLRPEEIQGMSYAGQDHHGEKTMVVQFTEGFAKVSQFRTREEISRFTLAVANAIDAEEARRAHNASVKKAQG